MPVLYTLACSSDGLPSLVPAAAAPTEYVFQCATGTPALFPLDQSPFAISTDDGLLISAAIIGVWSIAWAGKALYHALSLKGDY